MVLSWTHGYLLLLGTEMFEVSLCLNCLGIVFFYLHMQIISSHNGGTHDDLEESGSGHFSKHRDDLKGSPLLCLRPTPEDLILGYRSTNKLCNEMASLRKFSLSGRVVSIVDKTHIPSLSLSCYTFVSWNLNAQVESSLLGLSCPLSPAHKPALCVAPAGLHPLPQNGIASSIFLAVFQLSLDGGTVA